MNPEKISLPDAFFQVSTTLERLLAIYIKKATEHNCQQSKAMEDALRTSLRNLYIIQECYKAGMPPHAEITISEDDN